MERGLRSWGRVKAALDSPFWAVAEYKECLSLYDKQQRGKIKATDLLMVMVPGGQPNAWGGAAHLQTHRIGE